MHHPQSQHHLHLNMAAGSQRSRSSAVATSFSTSNSINVNVNAVSGCFFRQPFSGGNGGVQVQVRGLELEATDAVLQTNLIDSWGREREMGGGGIGWRW